jgi:hypothetical protein
MIKGRKRAVLISKMDRKMIREGKRGGFSRDLKVGRVMRDGDTGSNDRVEGQGNREQETVDARSPRGGRGNIIGNMEKGMGIMRGVIKIEFSFESRPGRDERRGRKMMGRRGGVCCVLNEIEITTKKSIIGSVGFVNGSKEMRIEVKITRFEVDVEKLKRGTIAQARDITTQLNETTSDIRKRNINSIIKTRNSGRINNSSTGMGHIKIITRNVIREIREGKILRRGKMSFLETDNIMSFSERVKGRGDFGTTMNSARVGRIIRETTNIIGENTRNRKKRSIDGRRVKRERVRTQRDLVRGGNSLRKKKRERRVLVVENGRYVALISLRH